MGVSLSLHRHILILYPLFSLAQEAQEKSLAKKKRHIRTTASQWVPLLRLCRRFRRLRAATNAPRVGSAPPFEKGGRKLPKDNAVAFSLNPNLSYKPQKRRIQADSPFYICITYNPLLKVFGRVWENLFLKRVPTSHPLYYS